MHVIATQTSSKTCTSITIRELVHISNQMIRRVYCINKMILEIIF